MECFHETHRWVYFVKGMCPVYEIYHCLEIEMIKLAGQENP